MEGVDSGTPPPGREGFGRVIINTTDAEAIARKARDAGFETKPVSHPGLDRPVFFLTDPDGYRIEAYCGEGA